MGIAFFPIIQEQVDIRGNARQSRNLAVAAGFNARMQGRSLRAPKELLAEHRLKHRLSAGERDPSSGRLVEWTVLQDLFHHGFNGYVAACQLQCFR